MTYDANKETVDRFVKALDHRIKTVERIILKRETELNVLIQQQTLLNAMIQETAEKTKDHVPTDEDMSMVRVPWTLLAALDVTLTDAGSDKIMAAKELRKYTDDDAEVRLSGAEAFYQEHKDG